MAIWDSKFCYFEQAKKRRERKRRAEREEEEEVGRMEKEKRETRKKKERRREGKTISLSSFRLNKRNKSGLYRFHMRSSSWNFLKHISWHIYLLSQVLIIVFVTFSSHIQMEFKSNHTNPHQRYKWFTFSTQRQSLRWKQNKQIQNGEILLCSILLDNKTCISTKCNGNSFWEASIESSCPLAGVCDLTTSSGILCLITHELHDLRLSSLSKAALPPL